PALLPERGQHHARGDGEGQTEERTPPRERVQAVQHFQERLLDGVLQECIVHTRTPRQRAAQAAEQSGAQVDQRGLAAGAGLPELLNPYVIRAIHFGCPLTTSGRPPTASEWRGPRPGARPPGSETAPRAAM